MLYCIMYIPLKGACSEYNPFVLHRKPTFSVLSLPKNMTIPFL